MHKHDMSDKLLASVQPPFGEEKSQAVNRHGIDSGVMLAEQALHHGAAFVCLPEFFNVFGLPEERMLEAARRNWRPLLERMQALSARFGAHVVCPMLVPEADGARNRAYLCGPGGEVVGFYDKIHPTLGERENLGIRGGDRIGVFETASLRVAIAVCYDIYFPELFVALARRKPDVVFFPSLQRSEREMASEALLKARAMDTSAYVVRSSYGCPSDKPWVPGMMFGQSCVVHPDGTILANAGHYEGLALARVRVPFVWQRPRCGGYPCLPVRQFLDEDRRPDLFPPAP